MNQKETKQENELLHAQSRLLIERLQETKDELKHSDKFTRDSLHDFDLVLAAADKMAKELPANSVARMQYERIKSILNIR